MAMQRQLRVLDTEEADGPVSSNTLKVAFATSDLKKVDQHFGSAERFAIYSVDANKATLLTVSEFGKLAQDGNENKLLEKFVILDGCSAVYCLAVGASAVRQLVGLGVQPVKVQFGTTINKLLKEIQEQLQGEPSGWLKRAMESKDNSKAFDSFGDESWDD